MKGARQKIVMEIDKYFKIQIQKKIKYRNNRQKRLIQSIEKIGSNEYLAVSLGIFTSKTNWRKEIKNYEQW